MEEEIVTSLRYPFVDEDGMCEVSLASPKSCLKNRCRSFILIHLEAPSPQMTSTGDQYFTYDITMQTSDPAFTLSYSSVPRRYSEFCWLRKALSNNDVYDTKIPSLPTRGLFRDRMNPAFLEKRRMGLQDFLYQAVATPLLKADKALHLFLQTTLSTADIDLNLRGLRRDTVPICPFRDFVDDSDEGPFPIAALSRLTANSLTTSYNASTGSNSSYIERLQRLQCCGIKVEKKVTFCDVVESYTFVNMLPVFSGY